MTITLQAVNELIASMESAGELSINETKVMALAKAYQQLAAENVALKRVPETDSVAMLLALDSFRSESLPDVGLQKAFESLMYHRKTPTTDAYLAGIKADGASEFISRLQQCVDEGDFVGDEVAVIVGAIDCGKEFCEQLREGVDK
ncbi:TPA: hypothetical protein MD289_005165 [Klebsiella pneumoniae]|nr:hypothetical protein [Klebsiella pneumoniae]